MQLNNIWNKNYNHITFDKNRKGNKAPKGYKFVVNNMNYSNTTFPCIYLVKKQQKGLKCIAPWNGGGLGNKNNNLKDDNLNLKDDNLNITDNNKVITILINNPNGTIIKQTVKATSSTSTPLTLEFDFDYTNSYYTLISVTFNNIKIKLLNCQITKEVDTTSISYNIEYPSYYLNVTISKSPTSDNYTNIYIDINSNNFYITSTSDVNRLKFLFLSNKYACSNSFDITFNYLTNLTNLTNINTKIKVGEINTIENIYLLNFLFTPISKNGSQLISIQNIYPDKTIISPIINMLYIENNTFTFYIIFSKYFLIDNSYKYTMIKCSVQLSSTDVPSIFNIDIDNDRNTPQKLVIYDNINMPKQIFINNDILFTVTDINNNETTYVMRTIYPLLEKMTFKMQKTNQGNYILNDILFNYYNKNEIGGKIKKIDGKGIEYSIHDVTVFQLNYLNKEIVFKYDTGGKNVILAPKDDTSTPIIGILLQYFGVNENYGVKNFIIDNKLYLISYSSEDKNYKIFIDYNNIYISNANIITNFGYNDQRLMFIKSYDPKVIGIIQITYKPDSITYININSRNNITLESSRVKVNLNSNIIFEVPLKIIKYSNNSQNYNIQLFSMYFKNSVEMIVDTGGGSEISILRSQLTDDYINSTLSLIQKWDGKAYDYFGKPATIINKFIIGMNINELNILNSTTLDIVYTVVPVFILRDDHDITLNNGNTHFGAQVFGGNNRNIESPMYTLLNNPFQYINSKNTVVSGGSVLINENKENMNKNKEPQFQYVSFVPNPLKNEMCIRFLSDIDTQIQKKYISSIPKDNGATLACRINTKFSYNDNNNLYEYNNIGQYSSNQKINNIIKNTNLSNLKNTGTGFAGGLDDNIPVVGLYSGGGNLSLVGTNSPNFNAENFMNNYKNLSDIFDTNSNNFFPFDVDKVSVSINNNKIKTKTNVNANFQLIDSYNNKNIYTFNINIDKKNDNNNLNNGGMYGGIYIYKSSDDFRSNLNTVFFRYNSITYPLNYYNDKITPSKIYLSPIN